MSFEEWWYAKYGSESCKDRAEDAYTAGYEAGIEAAANLAGSMAERPYDNEPEFAVCLDIESRIRQLKRGEG